MSKSFIWYPLVVWVTTGLVTAKLWKIGLLLNIAKIRYLSSSYVLYDPWLLWLHLAESSREQLLKSGSPFCSSCSGCGSLLPAERSAAWSRWAPPSRSWQFVWPGQTTAGESASAGGGSGWCRGRRLSLPGRPGARHSPTWQIADAECFLKRKWSLLNQGRSGH